MSDPNTQPAPLPMWQRIINSPRFMMTLIKLLTASGIFALPVIQKWFPGLTAESLGGYIVVGIPFIVTYLIDWYRTHPDNLVRRAIKAINGGTVSPAVQSAVASAAINSPPAPAKAS